MNEFDLIRDVFQRHEAASHAVNQSPSDALIDCGIGDDAAVINTGLNKLVTCTDTLIAGRHFPNTTSAYAIGYKSVAVNFSDLAAMGSTPHSILLALALPQHLKEDKNWLDEFANGLFACCAEHNVQLIGGDTTKSDVLTITVTAMGFAEQCIYRNGAQIGDAIVVTGEIGSAAFALTEIMQGKPSKLQSALDTPSPKVEVGHWLNNQNIATSMIDISDGLLQDLGHICQQSRVGARLDLEKLPTHPYLNRVDLHGRLALQLSGGDDYELLFTCPKKQLNQIKQCELETSLTIIGEIIELEANKPIHLFYENQSYLYNGKGYMHF